LTEWKWFETTYCQVGPIGHSIMSYVLLVILFRQKHRLRKN